MPKIASVSLFATLSFFIFAANAQVYRCKAASGKTVFSDVACPSDQVGGLIANRRSAESIAYERSQAAEANERHLRSQPKEPVRHDSGGEVRQPEQASSQACVQAKRELSISSNIKTLSENDKRIRFNAAVAQVNADCGTNTPLMQEPARVHPRSRPAPNRITRCDRGFCYDNTGGVYHRIGPNNLSGSNGQFCTRAGNMWHCS